jgi:hypothetical protein
MNPGYEILFSVSALHRDRADALRAVVPSAMAGGGSGFWIRRR